MKAAVFKLPRSSLQWRFSVVVLLVLGAMLALTLALWFRQTWDERKTVEIARQSTHELLLRQLRESGDAQVRQLADSLANPLYYFDLDKIGVLARDALRSPNVSYVLVYDREGRVLHDGSGEIAAYGQPMRDALSARIVAANAPMDLQADGQLDISSPIKVGDDRLGGVRVGYSMTAASHAEEATLASLRKQLSDVSRRGLWWLLLMCAGLAGVCVLGVVVVQRMLVRPIRQLGDVARKIEHGDFASPMPAVTRNDELGDLIHSFDRMRDSVARHDRDMRRVAYSDALTGLANRLAFRTELDQRLREMHGAGGQLVLLFADLDDFKGVNDTLGHEAGDDVLVQMAMRIESTVRAAGEAEAMVARLGGDEFVILLEAPAGGDRRGLATRLAESLVQELIEPLLLHGRRLVLGTSVGVAIFPDDADSASQLMKCGDIAMYQAKFAGKNCYRFYSHEVAEDAMRRMRMEQNLRGAWERGEMSVVYQPIYRTSDRALMGAEALLRWTHPVDGPIPPELFVPVAEQSGLIEDIGVHVLQAACNEAASWPELPGGGHAFVSVNVSGQQMRNVALFTQVTDALRDSGLAAERLHLEVTETAVIRDVTHAADLLSRLRAVGVRVWLDDFGTGYSSLNHLRRVQVDGLKIDRSFIADLLEDAGDLALTSATMAMAHSLGIVVVAEGVEQRGQYDLLRERDGDFVQGYWLSHPLSAAEFARLLD